MSDHSDPQRVLAAALRQDLAAFIQRSFHEVVAGSPFLPNWHIDAMAYALEQVLAGNIKRLLITVPPRHLKSICASVAFPAWALGHDPTRRIIAVSYADELAGKHALDCRRIIESPWYRQVFPGTRLSKSKNTEGEYVTTQGGYRYSTSVGGALTGRGGNLIIIDDPQKPADALSELKRKSINEWYDNTLYSRLDNKAEDPIVLVMQRLHLEDLVGHVLERGQWAHLNLPAIAQEDEEIRLSADLTYYRRAGALLHPARESAEDLEEIARTLGSYGFYSQYLQQPVPVEGAILQWRWFPRYHAPLKRQPGDLIVQSWDPATVPGENNDYSVCTTWLIREQRYYLVDLFRQRIDYPTLRREVHEGIRKWQPNEVIIELMNTGTALWQELRHNAIEGRGPLELLQIQGMRPRMDKVSRMSACSAVIEAGQVLLPDFAPWLDELRPEVLQFPHGRYDDQIDSISQFLLRMACRQPLFRPAATEEPLLERRRLREFGWPKPGICFD